MNAISLEVDQARGKAAAVNMDFDERGGDAGGADRRLSIDPAAGVLVVRRILRRANVFQVRPSSRDNSRWKSQSSGCGERTR